jgi:hypothetical protein
LYRLKEILVNKIALFAFKGDPVCFVHVLLNALDMHAQEYDVKIVLEGEATRLVPELAQQGNPLFGLYSKVKGLSLIDAVCRACSSKMGVLKDVEAQGLPISDEMSGHPSMARYRSAGYEILTF